MYLLPNTLCVCNPFHYICIFIGGSWQNALCLKTTIKLSHFNSNVLGFFFFFFSVPVSCVKSQNIGEKKNAHVKFLTWSNRFSGHVTLGSVWVWNITSHYVTQFFVFFYSSRKAEMKERHDEIRKKYGKLLLTLLQIYSVYIFWLNLFMFLLF